MVHYLHHTVSSSWFYIPSDNWCVEFTLCNFKTIPEYSKNHNVVMVCGNSTLFKADDEIGLLDRKDMIKFNINRIKEVMNVD